MTQPIRKQDEALAADPSWQHFCAVNERRRAVRDFDGTPLPDADIEAILKQALLAPSSGNLQPYQLHWLRDPAQKAALAAACNSQRAAASASALIVVVARLETAHATLAAHARHVETSPLLSAASRDYHRKETRKFGTFLRWAPLWLLAPFGALLALVNPALSLLPFGRRAMRHWATRSSIYAAQTLLLAASARGLDACPMEGFDPRAVVKQLGLPRGSVVPLVIAIGRRRSDARVEPRWRRDWRDAVVVH